MRKILPVPCGREGSRRCPPRHRPHRGSPAEIRGDHQRAQRWPSRQAWLPLLSWPQAAAGRSGRCPPAQTSRSRLRSPSQLAAGPERSLRVRAPRIRRGEDTEDPEDRTAVCEGQPPGCCGRHAAAPSRRGPARRGGRCPDALETGRERGPRRRPSGEEGHRSGCPEQVNQQPLERHHQDERTDRSDRSTRLRRPTSPHTCEQLTL